MLDERGGLGPCGGHKRRRRLPFPTMICAEPVPFEPPRAPAWARPSGSFRDNSEAEALFFAGAALSALDSVARSDPPWAGVWRRRLALKSAAAVAAKPAQPARGRGGAARRDRPRQTGPRARARGTGLFRLPRRSPAPAILSAPSGSPPPPPTCSRRSTRKRRRSSPPRSGRRAGAAGRRRSPRPRPLRR